MPTNLIKVYDALLELLYPNERANIQSIKAVFTRDFCADQPASLRTVPIHPSPAEGEDKVERLFRHLTTVITDEKTRKREFESDRSIRLHWIRYHLEEKKADLSIFKVEDENRIYVLNKDKRYVVVLEPLRNVRAYYLLTAYRLQESNYRKILRKEQKRGQPI